MLPSYDEVVKWRWGVPTWRLRYQIFGGLLLLALFSFFIAKTFGWSPLKQQATADRALIVDRSVVGGDVVQGDKIVTPPQQSAPERNPAIEQRKIEVAIGRSVKDGHDEIQRLVEETNLSKNQISREHNRRGTLTSGMFIKDQADRVKKFRQDCVRTLERVDRTIEDALIEQEATLETTEWLTDERTSYQLFAAFIAEKQNEVSQDGKTLAGKDEALWVELMNK